MATIDDRKKTAAPSARYRTTLAGVVLKCSVCLLVLALLLLIGMQAGDMPDGVIVAGAFQQGVPYSFYVK